jgi:prepilin-type processing-associated H-X9-DG protein
MAKNSRIPRRIGFTLLELLVVIGIIVVLIGILVPTFLKVREKARLTACQSNMRQLTVAWASYATEHGGMMIYTVAAPQGWVTDPVQNGLLYSYVKSSGVYRCPTDPRDPIQVPWSYAINDYLNGSHNFLQSTATNVNEIRQPSKTFVFLDAGATFAAGYVAPGFWPPNGWVAGPCYWHDGTNLTFVDGHAEYLKWTDPRTSLIWQGTQPPQPDNLDLQALVNMMNPK